MVRPLLCLMSELVLVIPTVSIPSELCAGHAVCEAHTPYRQNLVFLRLQPLKMVASLLAPVVAKAFQGPWDSEESRRVLSPEPQRLLARALGAASVQEVQVACPIHLDVCWSQLPKFLQCCRYHWHTESLLALTSSA